MFIVYKILFASNEELRHCSLLFMKVFRLKIIEVCVGKQFLIIPDFSGILIHNIISFRG